MALVDPHEGRRQGRSSRRGAALPLARPDATDVDVLGAVDLAAGHRHPRRRARRGRRRCSSSSTAPASGAQMQATAQNPTVARILGIPVERMVLYTFLINAALVGARLVPDLADLPREVLERRDHRPRRLHRGDRRRLQPGARRARRRPAGRRRRQPRRRLRLDRSTAPPCRWSCSIVIILFRPQGLLGRAEERTV